MLAARLKIIIFTLMITQIVGVTAAFALWCHLVLKRHGGSMDDSAVPILCLSVAFFIAIIGFLILFFKQVTRFSDSTRSITVRILTLAELTLLAAGALPIIVALWYRVEDAPGIVLGYTATAMSLVFFLHLLAGTLLNIIYNLPRNKLKVLVVGMNSRTEAFCHTVRSTHHLGAEVHGYIDVKKVENAPVKYLGTIDELGDILRVQVIDMTAIFLPIRSYYDTIDHIIETCGFYGVTSYLIGNVFGADTAQRVPTSINDFGNMAYSTIKADYVGLACKRLFDFLFALGAIILLSPILVVTGLFIKCVSKGPIFFKQERIGLNKRSFLMVKFRTMIPDAEKMQDQLAAMNEMDGAAFKITNDPRLIRGGGFLRRHSFDELPQLWNVLRGEMSVVGPRPLSRRDYDLLKEDWQRKRFSMRPGLTCIWQVSESRNDVSFMEWMQMDLDYIDQWSLGLDFRLIFRTIKTVLVGSGK